MRYTEFTFTHNPTVINEGYTKGDLAETVWGAAVAAAFENYPNGAKEADVVRIISNLDGSLNYKAERSDGLKSELTDKVIFTNDIRMKDHIADLRDIQNAIKKISGEIPGILNDANSQVKTAGLEVQEIFANGIADSITIGAEGGADQAGTKVDVSIVHRNTEGEEEVVRLGYSLKTDTAASGVMPVSQYPGVNKGSGGQVEFFADLGVVDDIQDALLDEYKALDEKLRDFVNKNASDGKLEKEFEKELRAYRRENEGVLAFNKNIIAAAEQINSKIDTDGEEAAFFDDCVKFLTKHINKDEEGIKLLTFDKKGAYTTTVEKFAENVRSLKVRAKPVTSRSTLEINAIDEEGNETLVFKLRFIASGGRFSGSTYRKSLKKKSVRDGKELASGYELLRYKIYVETGPGYKKAAQVS